MQISSERLLIRIPTIDDAECINAAIRESINELRNFMPWANKTPSIEETRQNLMSAISLIEKREDFRLLIFDKSGEFIGSSGLHKLDWRIPKAEIGYWIRSTKCGFGYATEAVQAICNHAQINLGIKRIEIVISGMNTRSRLIPERLGFVLEGILKMERVNPDGKVDDTYIYAKIVQPANAMDASGAADF